MHTEIDETRWIKTVIVEPFPVFFAHGSLPSESRRETARGPFYAPGSASYSAMSEANMAFELWRAEFLRERGWTVLVLTERRRACGGH